MLPLAMLVLAAGAQARPPVVTPRREETPAATEETQWDLHAHVAPFEIASKVVRWRLTVINFDGAETKYPWTSQPGGKVQLPGWTCAPTVDIPTWSLDLWLYSFVCWKDGQPDLRQAIKATMAACALDPKSGQLVRRHAAPFQVLTFADDFSTSRTESLASVECELAGTTELEDYVRAANRGPPKLKSARP